MDLEIALPRQSFDLKRIRIVLAIGAVMILVFMLADLSLIPASLQSTYIASRLYLQLPSVVIFFALSYWRGFYRMYDPLLCAVMAWLSLVNFGFIVICWTQEGFVFPYEGVLMYAFFGFFAMRLVFRFAIYYVAIITFAFYLIVQFYPIYGDRSFVNLGFVFGAQIIGLVGLYDLKRTINSLNQANDSLRNLSEVDQLTGLYNRRYYENKAGEVFAWCRRSQCSLAIYMVDIDHFKDYNDGYGHQQGDQTIALQAEILKRVFAREWDLVARYGGEEFVVLAPQMSSEQAKHQAQRILDEWQKEAVQHSHGKGTGIVNCSIGIHCASPAKNQTIQEFLGFADKALYHAKAAGRACFKMYLSTEH